MNLTLVLNRWFSWTCQKNFTKYLVLNIKIRFQNLQFFNRIGRVLTLMMNKMMLS